MAATLYVSASIDAAPVPGSAHVWLDDAAPYWFLRRYFEAARLPNLKGEVIDLYDSREISGYLLDRLIEELEFAEADVMAWQSVRKVLVGWNGNSIGQETEIRETLRKDDVLETIDSILSLARVAKGGNLNLISSGD